MRIKTRENIRRRRAANPEAERERDRAWRAANAEAEAVRKKAWRQNNLEEWRASERQRRLSRPEQEKKKSQAKRMRRQQVPGTFTAKDIIEIRELQRGKCGYCREPFGKKYHIDHIIPISKGGTNIRRNLQLLCAPCNLSKCNKMPNEFAREKGRLL